MVTVCPRQKTNQKQTTNKHPPPPPPNTPSPQKTKQKTTHTKTLKTHTFFSGFRRNGLTLLYVHINTFSYQHLTALFPVEQDSRERKGVSVDGKMFIV